jgi:hypothetical protein
VRKWTIWIHAGGMLQGLNSIIETSVHCQRS